MTTTAESVLNALAPYALKNKGNGEYRCNSPLRPGANSHSFSLTIHDSEHGVWTDHAGGESGSLYELAERLGIEISQSISERKPVESSLREYKGLAEYAALKGVPEQIFIDAKWTETTYKNRPALEFPTKSGKRWRFLDGNKPKFINETGYKACWYGLDKAIKLTVSPDCPIIICNGEPSVIVGQHYELPVCAITGGEQPTIPRELLKELYAKWNGVILLAMDCDEAGRKSAKGKQKILQDTGYDVKVVDLGLGDKGDLADYCKLYQMDSLSQLMKLSPVMPDSPNGINSPAPIIPIVKRSERLSNYIHKLTNFDNPLVTPGVPFPLPVLHRFGGLALVLKPGKMCGIVGVSGGGKTTCLENIVDYALGYQTPCLVWSPEWTADEFVERAVQRYSGPRTDELYLHEIFIDEYQRGIKKGFGKELTQEQLESASSAIKKLRQFETEVGYLEMPMLTVGYLRQALGNTLQSLSYKPRLLILDYVQLLMALEQGSVSMYDLTLQIGLLGVEHGLSIILASQATKSSSKTQASGGLLDSLAARYVNDDAFKLFITINPDRAENGDFLPSVVFNVAKNSSGIKGKVRVGADWARGIFGSTPHINQNFSDEE